MITIIFLMYIFIITKMVNKLFVCTNVFVYYYYTPYFILVKIIKIFNNLDKIIEFIKHI